MQVKRAFVFLLACVALAFAACGAPTFESQVERYKRNIDKLDALAVKQPNLKADIEKKKMDFASDMEAAKMKGGEEGTRALQVLCARMETFEKDITPAAPQAAQPAQPAGGKLGPGASAPPAQPAQPAQPAGGKLGGAAQPAQPAATTGGSGFGGTPAPATTAPAATTPPPATGGESGFGGK